MRNTHTLATLAVPDTVFSMIKGMLHEAGYDHAIEPGMIDMTGIGVIPDKAPPPLAPVAGDSLVRAAPAMHAELVAARAVFAEDLDNALRSYCHIVDGVPDRNSIDPDKEPGEAAHVGQIETRLASIDTILAVLGRAR